MRENRPWPQVARLGSTLIFRFSQLARAPRPGEEHGREYYFHSREKFQDMVAKGDMLEHASFGNYYGGPKGPVEEAINGRDVLFDIDWQGGQQVLCP